MPRSGLPFRSLLATATLGLGAMGLAACGGSSDDGASVTKTTQERPAQGLGAIKGYLAEHTERLVSDTARLQGDAEAYHRLAEGAGFDYDRMLTESRAETRRLVGRLQAGFRRANPSYEEMEGVVAGVPELADFDVIIDAGGDGKDPENAVPFTIKTPKGRTFAQPGNFFFLVETSVFGTEKRFTAPDVRPDLNGDGKVEFGEALPDADFLLAVTRDFSRTARELKVAGERWSPTERDVFNALVVMTPTMSEYFEAWKNSRFVAGDDAKESAFAGASRLQDIADILGGLQVIYRNVQPRIAKASGTQAAQTRRSLDRLTRFAARLRDEERGGRRFTPEQAETLGSDAQEQAEAIAGQVAQAAGRLGVELPEA